ncbi:MAG: inorganic phosphate transporter [Armatimonadota bacterium]|nr:inorganic phosphate transporter [bacterium]
MSLYLVATIILVALIFDFLNGFHDAANSIATIVATKVLSPFQAVLWAAFFNFLAPIVFGVHVADTVSKVVNASLFQSHTMMMIALSGLVGAIFWNIITWYVGLPTSSSHALIGGLAGAGLTAAHLIHGSTHNVLNWEKIDVIALFIVLSPMIGMILGYAIQVIVYWLFKDTAPSRVDGLFRHLQLLSAAAYSVGHGTNDAQKTMGVISIVLLTAGHLHLVNGAVPVPLWVKLACATAIACGTMSGGWRIVKTMGLGITKLRPVGGFCAETAGAATIIGASLFGIPVSTTHTITGAIVGVGATHRLSAVKWGVAGRIVWAWVLTMPLSAVMASAVYFLIHVSQ